jgi:hypothetical protein
MFVGVDAKAEVVERYLSSASRASVSPATRSDGTAHDTNVLQIEKRGVWLIWNLIHETFTKLQYSSNLSRLWYCQLPF